MDNKLLPLGKVSKSILIALSSVFAIWYVFRIVSFLISMISESQRRNIALVQYLTLDNICGFIVYAFLFGLHVLMIVFLCKNKLNALRAGIINIVLISLNVLTTVISMLFMTNQGYGTPINLLVVQSVRYILFILCVVFIFFSKRRWLGYHIVFYLFRLIDIYSNLDAMAYNAGHMDAINLTNYVFSALSSGLMIYEAVLVLMKSKKSIS